MTPNSVFYGPIEMPPNLQINWSHRITNKTPEDFIILSSSGSLRIQILSPKKKKKKRERERVDLRQFNSSALEIIKRACSVKDKRDFFHYPCNNHQAPPLSSCFLPPSLSLSLSHTHTHRGRTTWAGSLRRHCHLVDSRLWSKKYLKHRSLLWELMKIKICHFS